MKKNFVISIILIGFFSIFFSSVSAQQFSPDPMCVGITGQCCDGIDNNNPPDGKADYYGASYVDDQGRSILLDPDSGCYGPKDPIEDPDVPTKSTIIPCVNKCSFSDVIKLINNGINFLLTVILLPLFVIMLMYAGYQYLTAQGNSSKVANVKKLVKNLVLGLVIILTAWLVVKVVLQTVGLDQGLLFLE